MGHGPRATDSRAGGLLLVAAAAFRAAIARECSVACNISQYVLWLTPGNSDPARMRAEETGMARRKSALELVRPDANGAPSRHNRINFFELAYQRIEELLVNCELKPGRFLTVQELQTVTGFGRTPVHTAVNQFAADTLILIRPRHGLQIAPIDLVRERLLLGLRRVIERLLVKLAADPDHLSHRYP